MYFNHVKRLSLIYKYTNYTCKMQRLWPGATHLHRLDLSNLKVLYLLSTTLVPKGTNHMSEFFP